ncbi:MAG: orotidine-5'-phosphate decarboxylase [Bdellovibrionales bacterium]|nr:orotidine-5'-phosphate decarboxylase [Bdellovibrionales bacterium]
MKKLPLFVALDVDTEEKALFVARETSPYVEGFKIGPRLFLKQGPSIISKLKNQGKIFLDLKFFDIPSTMESAVQSAFDIGVDLLTVHAQAGKESLKHLAKREAKLKRKRDFKILAVTVLTSFSQRDLPPLSRTQSLLSHVESLSDMVLKSGLTGLVCSGAEVAHLRHRHPEAYLLTPGIRLTPHPHSMQDQKRVFTPKQAIKAGSNALVIGRPVYESKDPAGVCDRLKKELTPLL